MRALKQGSFLIDVLGDEYIVAPIWVLVRYDRVERRHGLLGDGVGKPVQVWVVVSAAANQSTLRPCEEGFDALTVQVTQAGSYFVDRPLPLLRKRRN